MQFLCLAYGDEAGWKALGEEQRRAALAADAVIRERGNLMSAVRQATSTVSNRDGKLVVGDTPYARHPLPLAGFSVIEAKDLQEAIALVSQTPCARAQGYIEIRALWNPQAE